MGSIRGGGGGSAAALTNHLSRGNASSPSLPSGPTFLGFAANPGERAATTLGKPEVFFPLPLSSRSVL